MFMHTCLCVTFSIF
ncbi:Protein of unknown function [Gryllus bimaculatus]|nr:Protein of unknown function [Gryllus bimaculatus]